MEIKALTHNGNQELWEKTAMYAQTCSWQETGQYLSDLMMENKLSDWERVFVALEDDSIAGFCALTKTCSLQDVAYTPFIGFVFVGEAFRGRRISEELCRYAIAYAKTAGFQKVYLYSNIPNLYEKYGFIKIDEKEAPWGEMQSIYRHCTQ